eukprot:Hpha_TRINITY_DN33574_c0_g1::TRINITY_DN33574_c0_g1_i1::g.171077::m.171077
MRSVRVARRLLLARAQVAQRRTGIFDQPKGFMNPDHNRAAGLQSRWTRSDYIESFFTWVAAFLLVSWIFDWHFKRTVAPVEKVSRKELADTHAAEFELMQARVNSKVKETDRGNASFYSQEPVKVAIREEKDARSEKVDFMTDYVNGVREDGTIGKRLSDEASFKKKWQEKLGNVNWAEVDENIKEKRRMNVERG